MIRLVSLAAACLVLTTATAASAAIKPGAYEGDIDGDTETLTLKNPALCIDAKSLGSGKETEYKRGLCYDVSALYEVACTVDGEPETIRQGVLSGLHIPRSGKLNAVQVTRMPVTATTIGNRRPGAKGKRRLGKKTATTRVRLKVTHATITGMASYKANFRNTAGHTVCSGRVRFRLQRVAD